MNIKRYATYEDIISIAKENESVSFKVPTEGMYKHGKIYVATEKGICLGYVILLKEYGSGLYSIPSLAVRNEYKGRGIMKQLMLEAFISSGAKKIWLEVHPDNIAALALYDSLGFKKTGESQVEYPDGKKIVLMEVVLDQN